MTSRLALTPVGTPSTLSDGTPGQLFDYTIVDAIPVGDGVEFHHSIEVDEEFPANPDVVLEAMASVQPHLTAGNVVELAGSAYGDQQVAPANGVYLFSRAQALFDAGTAGQKRWCESGGNNVTLRGIKLDRYGTQEFHSDAALRFPSGSSGWHLIDFEVMRAVSACIQLRGSGHTLTRPVLHDYGRYGWTDGTNTLLEDAHVYNGCLEGGLVPRNASNGDNGACKMAGGSSGVEVDGILLEDISGVGVWWDGARDGKVSGVRSSNVQRQSVSVEVSWGGAEDAPPGKSTTFPNPAFFVDDVEVEGQHGIDSGNENWPGPAALVVSMSPGVALSNIHVRDSSNGLTVIYSAGHNVFTNGFPAQSISPEWAQENLSVERVTWSELDVDNITRFTAAYTGGSPSIEGLHWDSGQGGYGSDPRFRWMSNMNYDLTDWQGLGFS